MPIAFVAVAVNVYEWPFVSPPTVIGLDDPVACCPPLAGLVRSLAVTVYDVTGLPLAGAGEKDTRAEPEPPVAVRPVGAPGAVAPAVATLAANSDVLPPGVVVVAVTVVGHPPAGAAMVAVPAELAVADAEVASCPARTLPPGRTWRTPRPCTRRTW